VAELDPRDARIALLETALERIAHLEEENRQLREENQQLKEQLSLKSSNSSLPRVSPQREQEPLGLLIAPTRLKQPVGSPRSPLGPLTQ